MVAQTLSEFWQRIFRRTSKPGPAPKFVDLAPTADADDAGIYFEALNYATNNDEVLNIALTGPYGSGKSSVIKSFLARYPRAPLQLSLAAFLPDGDLTGVRATKQEIERSLLQQILYGVEADKLPFSRFKRIQAPKKLSLATSLFITTGLGCAWYLLTKQADVMSGTFFNPLQPSNWFNLLCFGVVAAFAWSVVHGIYTTSFGLSLKSISLKDVQIAPVDHNEQSILNRHFDEILYFFQSTQYDLVVIEDLDRFESSDIFVTLREINGLINANEGIKRRVRFLYALRDDIFVNTDRTKFFEFIVPIIPIINQSNSIDKVLEQGKRIELDTKLNKQFLREVSRYLTDLRLIRNIFNEYVIYAGNLGVGSEGSLDPNKLLAILIYKNVIPKDFAALHKQDGTLWRLLRSYDQYVLKIEERIRADISAIEAELDIGDAQALRDQAELRRVYAMAIVARVPASYSILHAQGGNVNLSELAEGDALERIMAHTSVTVSGHPYSQRSTIDLSSLEKTVDPTRSFEQRKVALSRKSDAFRQTSEKSIRELRSQLASLRTRRFNEVIRESTTLIDELFVEVGDSRDLFKYLILEGYLDDTYYQYISLFHSGRLSPNDNNFLIRIRAYDNPPPDFTLDNTAEVAASMRTEDFGHHYVLNRSIIDHLLSNPAENAKRIADAVDFIASNFRSCGAFFRIYYATGSKVEALIQALAARWPYFAAVALDETDGASHAARILAYMPERVLKGTSNAAALRSFLTDSTRQVLAEEVEFELGRFRILAVEVAEVEPLADFPRALSYIARHGLYRISIENIRYVLEQVVGWEKVDNLEKRNLSTLIEANDPALLERIHGDFPVYVKDVLLTLQANTDEDIVAISEVLARDEVDYDQRAEFLKRQTTTFPNIDDIPAAFHQVALERHKVEPTWENCRAFMASGPTYDAKLLTTYLNDRKAAAALSRQPISGDEKYLELREFVAGNDALSSEVYRFYVRQMPKRFEAFPDVSASKIKVLVEERQVTFVPKTFEQLAEVDLKVLFVASNFAVYESRKDKYPIDDGFRSKLLLSTITDAQKLTILADMDQAYIASTPSVAAIVGPLLVRSPNAKRDYSIDFIKAVIVNSRDIKIQVSLFNKLQATLSVPDVREVLRKLPGSFQDIASPGRSPKIENSDINRQLAVWLIERKIISSFSDTPLGDEIRVYSFRK